MSSSSSTASLNPRPPPSNCQVCGEKASGHHYQVISCIGCKSFFRRAGVLGRIYTCKKGGECAPSSGIRRCKACRFQKCLSEGMNPLLFEPQNPQEARNAENLAVRTGNVQQSLVTMEERSRGVIADLAHANQAFERLLFSTFDPHPITECNESLVLNGPSKLGFYFEPLPSCSSQLVIPDLQSMKQFLALLDHTKFGGAPGSVKHWMSTGIVCAVELMKTLPIVERLPGDARRHLLLSSSLACAHFTDSFFSYQQSSPFTVYPDGTMPYGADPPYTLAAEFHTTVIERMRMIVMDQTELLLARVILCFSIEADEPSVEQSRALYTKILCSYTIATRGVRNGPSVFLEILSLIDYTLTLTRKLKDFLQLVSLSRRPAMRSPLIEAAIAS